MADFADLFAEAARLLRQHMIAFATVVFLSTAAGAAYDFAPLDLLVLSNIMFTLASLFLEASLIAAALGLEPVRTAGRRLASMFGVSLLSGLGILFGLVLLLIPGLVLMLRWSIAVPVLLAEESTVSGSLSRSWRLTADRWWLALPVLALFAIAWGPLIALYFLTGYPDSTPAWLVIPANFYVAVVSAFQWLLIVALYRALHEDAPADELPSIFS